MAEQVGTRERAASPWAHFFTLLVLGSGLQVAVTAGAARAAQHDAGATIVQVLSLLPGQLFTLLPVLAGVTVGVLRMRGGTVARAFSVVIAAVAIMAVADLVEAPAVRVPLPTLARQGGDLVSTPPARIGQVSAIRSAISWVGGELNGASDSADVYPPGHPRVRAAYALNKAGMFLLPAALVGLVLGVGAWVRRNVRFTSDAGGATAHLVLAWLLAPMGFWLVTTVARMATAQALFNAEPLGTIPLAYVGAAAVCALGWSLAWRTERADSDGLSW